MTVSLKKFNADDYLVRTVHDYISKVIYDLRKDKPFFGFLISRLKFVQDDTIQTAGVDGGRSLYYNEKYLMGLSSDKYDRARKMTFVFVHEVMHLALNHPFRIGNRLIVIETPDGAVTLWNIVCDTVINNMLSVNGYSLPEGVITPHNNSVNIFGIVINDISKKSAEELYSELAGQLKKQEKENNKNGQSKEDNQNGNTIKTDKKAPKSIDTHEKWSENHEEETDGKTVDYKDDWKKAIYRATEFAKTQGSSPLGMEREIECIGRSKVNWKQFIRREVAKSIPYTYNWNKPNKKYLWQDIFMPSYHGETVNVLISIDTSGSMSNRELGIIFTEMIGIAKTYHEVNFRILTHDCKVHDDIVLSGRTEQKIKNIHPHGGGGTDHNCLYTYIQEKKYNKHSKLLITFTDGYTSWPEQSVKFVNTLVVLVGGHCPKEQLPSWVKSITLE